MASQLDNGSAKHTCTEMEGQYENIMPPAPSIRWVKSQKYTTIQTTWSYHINVAIMTKYLPKGERRYAPTDGSSTVAKTVADLRLQMVPQSAHPCWPAVAKQQAARVPIA